jgi:ankyrin repeat protein
LSTSRVNARVSHSLHAGLGTGVQLGADLEAPDANGATPLHRAARNGLTAAVRALVAMGAQLNARQPSNGMRPLHWAAQQGHLQTLAVLVELGAPVGAANNEGDTPLHTAADKGLVEACRVLVLLGANVEGLDINRSTPLHRAARSGRTAAVRALVAMGAQVNARQPTGTQTRTPCAYIASTPGAFGVE